jgi:hypothetical protein
MVQQMFLSTLELAKPPTDVAAKVSHLSITDHRHAKLTTQRYGRGLVGFR